MLTAIVTVDLEHKPDDELAYDLDRADRWALQDLHQIPDGAELRIRVGRRFVLTHSAVNWLCEHSRRLHIRIDASEPQVARRWYDAIRNGEVS